MEPTAEDLNDPEFNAIWQAIKGWDIERNPGAGYAGATGTDVMSILTALRALRSEESPPEAYPFIVPQSEVAVECLNEKCRRSGQLRRASLPKIGNEIYLCGPIMCTCGHMMKIWENPDAV